MNPIYKQMIRSSVLGTLALSAMVFIPSESISSARRRSRYRRFDFRQSRLQGGFLSVVKRSF